MATKPPVEVPQGAIRLNTDSQKLEFFAQDQWWEMATDVPTLDGGARGVFVGGYLPSPGYGQTNRMDYVTIPTAGNAIDFGDVSHSNNNTKSATASSTRGVSFGGGVEPNAQVNTIDYFDIAITGKTASSFGNLDTAKRGTTSLASATRAVCCGGRTPTVQAVMEYITIASTGNAQDFGDITIRASDCTSMTSGASPTRGLITGGVGSPPATDISYITIASTGNDQDFGDLNVGSNGRQGCSNSIRLVQKIRENTTMESVQFATKGNAISFGESENGWYGMAVSSPIRGVFGGFSKSPAQGTFLADINYISMQSGGDTVDFGDLTQIRAQREGGCSNAHGGL